MNHPATFSAQRLATPVLATVAIVLAAPFMREIRELFFAAFPGGALRILAIGMVAILVVLLITALTRIRHHHGLRYGGLVLVLALLWLQIKGFSQVGLAATIQAEVNMVERFHIVEYGLLAILLYRACRPAGALWCLVLPLLWVTATGTADETVQWLAPRRTGEFRDVLMNIVAGATGLLFAICLQPPIKRLRGKPIVGLETVFRATAGTVLLLGVFIDTAHLGFVIDDPNIGRFRSWHSAEQLQRTATDRTQTWNVPNPPTGQEIFGIQDAYMEEAARHTQHRQESMRDGRLVMAWHANTILERYYAPYLDKRLPKGGTHRLPPRARARLESEGAPRTHPAGYESPVLRGRIWTRPPKKVFRAALALTVLALWMAPALLRAKDDGRSP